MTTDKKMVFVVYERVTEETYFYALPLTENTPLLQDLKTVHGTIQGEPCTSDVEAAQVRVREALELDWRSRGPKIGEPFAGPFDLVIHTGFIL